MNIDKYLKTIGDINFLIESLSNQDIKDVQASIDLTKQRMDAINAKINSRLNAQNQQYLPYETVRIEFLNDYKLSVRTATEKESEEFTGRENFNVVGYVENEFIILQKDEWDYTIGLKIYEPNMVNRIDQNKEAQLFYNEKGDIGSGVITRGSIKQEIKFRFISLK